MAQLPRTSRWAGLLGLFLIGSACVEQAPREHDDSPAPTPEDAPSPPAPDDDYLSVLDPFGGLPGIYGPLEWDGLYVRANGSDDVSPPPPNHEVLQLSGDRLYALSRFGGLSVVDAAEPALRRLGVYRSAGIPVDMYVEDGTVFALFDGWDGYACDADGSCRWHWTSRIQLLDARDAAAIRVVADLEMPGHIDAARRVGDVLYVVSDQFDGCWGCGDEYAVIAPRRRSTSPIGTPPFPRHRSA
jgi:hypothetical protein